MASVSELSENSWRNTSACPSVSISTFSSLHGGSLKPSSNAQSLKDSTISSSVNPSTDEKPILYLAYGSNLASSTFRGVRGIKPLAAVNVCVPSLRMTFDLPGIPYKEPCFANTGIRNSFASDDDTQHAAAVLPRDPEKRALAENKEPYHKNRWLKPLVGVVYTLTPTDFYHVIATEGGGASYTDVEVPCYVLPPGSLTVPSVPTGKPILAHTLFAPSDSSRFARPNPSYAQPSQRYLDLITTGATEHDLPCEYRDYLATIRPYTITTFKQSVGQALTLALWGPVIQLLFGLQRMFADERGRSPEWMVRLMGVIFMSVWRSYDVGFKGTFGDGERTIDAEGKPERSERRIDSKQALDAV